MLRPIPKRARRGAQRIGRQVRTDERGMTLIELLVGMVAAMVIILGGFAAVDAANRLTFGTQQRIEQISRGREAMERITRSIRSQQCFGSTRPMIYATDTAMEFYTSVTGFATTPGATQPIQRRRLEWIQDTGPGIKDISNGGVPVGDIYETVWTGYVTNAATGAIGFKATPDSKSIIANDVERAEDRRALAGTSRVPIFKYYKYSSTTGSGRVDYTAPVAMVSGKVPDADLPSLVVIEVGFKVVSRGTAVSGPSRKAMNFYNTISVRIADPTNPGGSPQCL